jgi:hypothetical protein
MMTLNLELSDELLARLRVQAQTRNISVEDFVVLALQEQVNLQPDDERSEVDDADFDALAKGVIEDNRELLKRLA